MRDRLPDAEMQLDRRGAQQLTRLHGEATQYSETAAKSQQTVKAGQAEQARRVRTAARFPELHETDTKARPARSTLNTSPTA
ncbi:hypothetical protein ACQYWQ_27595 [Streptomyces sp. P6-2-1]|uniref:hypothetical protein n=1 Tax=Streptomyces sp. P6-2-1 TaxID=3422591 RepID=UPI003D35F10F